MKSKVNLILELSKARMVPMVLVTAGYGFFLSGQALSSLSLLIWTVLGLSLVSAGSAALNNYLERDTDGLMVRTKNRVLPRGMMTPLFALIYGITSVLAGVFITVFRVNLLSGFLLLLAAFLYVLVYTPMKRWSWWNTFVGAIPGAIPPMVGWTAATGELGLGAWILFFILFTWQHPHFYAIAVMYEDDYRRGGFKMLPVIDAGYKRTVRHVIVYSILLLLVSILPFVTGMSGNFYLVGAILSGVLFLACGILFSFSKTLLSARHLFRASLIYLPILLLLFAIDFGLLM